jgi:hypothetical protein
MLQERIVLARERVPLPRRDLRDALCDGDLDDGSLAGSLASSAPT